jgi:acyl dehydratase
MPLTAQALMGYAIPEARQTVSPRDAILYALTTGYGSEPLDAAHLRRTQETGLQPAPTLANVVAHAGPWMKAAGVDWQKLVHSEHRLTVHRPLPLDAPLHSRSRMLSVVDRGVEKGMFATFERVIFAEDESRLATIIQTNACRGDGGCGSAGDAPEALPAVPEREPDARVLLSIRNDAALLYRLNGDLNPLHSDPGYAGRAGFPRPILHGLCTFGHAAYAIGRCTGSSGDIADIESIAARFTGVVFPGDRLEFQIWRDDRDIRFRVQLPERGVTALDNGTARLA